MLGNFLLEGLQRVGTSITILVLLAFVFFEEFLKIQAIKIWPYIILHVIFFIVKISRRLRTVLYPIYIRVGNQIFFFFFFLKGSDIIEEPSLFVCFNPMPFGCKDEV